MSKASKSGPLTNAERQRKRRESGPRPQMSVTVSRWVQAQLDVAAEAAGISLSEAVERLAEGYARMPRREGPMLLTARGAALLGACASCGKALRAGDRVRRAGEFATHHGCAEP